MILYGSPGGCSQAAHIALNEANIAHQYVKVGRDKRTEDGRDFNKINAKGYTPALEMEDGTLLTESLAILVYISEKAGGLLAESGIARWKTLEATEFMTTELHANFRPLFYPDATDAEREKATNNLIKRFDTLAEQLSDNAFLIGDNMTIADTYLFVMLSWADLMNIPVSHKFEAYKSRLINRPSVIATLNVEGLLPMK
ncbi:glutathione S-transferase N-terminal domain-containing protein [Pluralibacter gergoviae]